VQVLHNATVLEGISRSMSDHASQNYSGHYFWAAGISGWLPAYQYLHWKIASEAATAEGILHYDRSELSL